MQGSWRNIIWRHNPKWRYAPVSQWRCFLMCGLARGLLISSLHKCLAQSVFQAQNASMLHTARKHRRKPSLTLFRRETIAICGEPSCHFLSVSLGYSMSSWVKAIRSFSRLEFLAFSLCFWFALLSVKICRLTYFTFHRFHWLVTFVGRKEIMKNLNE